MTDSTAVIYGASRPKARRSLYIALYVIATMAIVITSFFFILRVSLDQLSDRGDIHIRQAGERLVGQVAGFKLLANTLTKNPEIIEVLDAEEMDPRINELLLENALTSGATLITVVSQTGETVASSDPSLVFNLSEGNFNDALRGTLSRQFGLLVSQDSRYLSFSRGIFAGSGLAIGVVTVVVDLAGLEFDWVIDDRVVLFTNETGQVLSSDRPQLINKWFDPSLAEDEDPIRVADYWGQILGHKLWRLDDTRLSDPLSLAKSDRNAILEFGVVSLQNIGPALSRSLIEAMLLAMLLAAIGFWLLLLNSRRETLAERLYLEAELNQTLEARVERRTQELRSTQAQLISAGKLNALGELAAEITHELNQPLAAIKNFVENGQKFIARGKTDKVKENLGLVSAQIDRISVIIKSLRAFAHKEKVTVEPVKLSSVLKESITLSAFQLKKAQITLNYELLPDNWIVQGGEIRLQQVFVNLILNAIEAMSGIKTDKKIEITSTDRGQYVQVSIRDTGLGLVDPTRVFEPFYTTKDRGGSKGLGLGLSISHGIIASFYGALTCENHPEGGAVFHVKLKKINEGE